MSVAHSRRDVAEAQLMKSQMQCEKRRTKAHQILILPTLRFSNLFPTYSPHSHHSLGFVSFVWTGRVTGLTGRLAGSPSKFE